MAIMDSTNNQFRDHSDFYFPYFNGGLVSQYTMHFYS